MRAERSTLVRIVTSLGFSRVADEVHGLPRDRTRGNVFKKGAWVVALKKGVESNHLMSSLARSLFSGLARRVPGGALLKRLGLKLPF